jgi:hypothetical protein
VLCCERSCGKELTSCLCALDAAQERPDFEGVYGKRLRNGNGWGEIATLHTKAVVALNVSWRPLPSRDPR